LFGSLIIIEDVDEYRTKKNAVQRADICVQKMNG